jgi:4-hydroxy-4-methyl-2-oxoglutarate aldolase
MAHVSLEEIRANLFTALLSDCLDAVGMYKQAMPSRIRPLDDASVLVGRARTAVFMETFRADDHAYDLEIALVDGLRQGEIPVFACGNPVRVAPWGELLSTAARARGAVGAVMDGCVRDIKAIRRIGFPVFHGGIAPLDTKGRAKVMAIDVPIECAGVPVASGDLVFGDADGLVVIPQAVEQQVLELAFDKLRREKSTLQELQAGDLLADVFARHGTL